MSSVDLRTLPDLFGTVINQLSTLLRQEVQLARAEAGEKVTEVAKAGALLAVGGVLLLAALIMLLQAIVTFLVYAGIPTGWAQLIVFVVIAVVGILQLRVGLSKLKMSNLTPSRTTEQLSRDAAVVREQVQ